MWVAMLHRFIGLMPGTLAIPIFSTTTSFKYFNPRFIKSTCRRSAAISLMLWILRMEQSAISLTAASIRFSSEYRVHIDHFSASENGIALFKQHVYDGLVTLANRSTSTWGDGISDAWRLRYFGSVTDLRSAASADPDGDGVNNLSECRA